MDQSREIQYSRLMVTIQLTCRHCESENIVRNGMTSNGKQRFLCKDCGKRSRQNPQPNGYTEEEREKICVLTKSAVACADWRVPSASRATLSAVGSKKGSNPPGVERHAAQAETR